MIQEGITLIPFMQRCDKRFPYGIDSAINLPFSQFPRGLDDIPGDKPVVVYCRTGDWSGEVAEILAERGYDVSDLEGGWKAYRDLLGSEAPVEIDAKGLKCPGPIVKVADTMRDMQKGQKLHVEATEDAFASDIAVWCERTGNKLLNLKVTPEVIEATIQKDEKPAEASASAGNDKNFVVFSGDLDKTIAAFIMANGAAAMGRNVTMFFTFWGLNILRRPEKVKVKKSFVEKMFGAGEKSDMSLFI